MGSSSHLRDENSQEMISWHEQLLNRLWFRYFKIFHCVPLTTTLSSSAFFWPQLVWFVELIMLCWYESWWWWGEKRLLGRSNLLVKGGSATSHALIWEYQNMEGKILPEIPATLAISAPITPNTPNTKGCLKIIVLRCQGLKA